MGGHTSNWAGQQKSRKNGAGCSKDIEGNPSTLKLNVRKVKRDGIVHPIHQKKKKKTSNSSGKCGGKNWNVFKAHKM